MDKGLKKQRAVIIIRQGEDDSHVQLTCSFEPSIQEKIPNPSPGLPRFVKRVRPDKENDPVVLIASRTVDWIVKNAVALGKPNQPAEDKIIIAPNRFGGPHGKV